MQREISAAAGLHEDLCAAILVDENLPCAGLLGLRHQEVEQHGLAAARGADDQRMAEIALVAVEEIGASGIGFEQRSEEHTSELQSLMRISHAVFSLKKKNE